MKGAAMPENSVKRKLTAILCADVKGWLTPPNFVAGFEDVL
jgi:hypothetical protein